MGTINLFRNAVKNPFTTVFFLVIAVAMAVVIYGDIQDMRSATTGYDYCQSLLPRAQVHQGHHEAEGRTGTDSITIIK